MNNKELKTNDIDWNEIRKEFKGEGYTIGQVISFLRVNFKNDRVLTFGDIKGYFGYSLFIGDDCVKHSVCETYDYISFIKSVIEECTDEFKRIDLVNELDLKEIEQDTTLEIEPNEVEIVRFKEGLTYVMGWIGDSEMFTDVTIIKRTEKTITFKIRDEEPKRCKIHVWEGVEHANVMGTYSMCPSVYANKEKAQQ
jgi:hypothetical protein